MTTLSKKIDRMDIVLHRFSDETIGVRWQVDYRDGFGYRFKDLSLWNATFEMIWNDLTVFSASCTCTSNGMAMCFISGSSFVSDSWKSRTDGEWRITAYGPDGEQEILGHGYYRIV